MAEWHGHNRPSLPRANVHSRNSITPSDCAEAAWVLPITPSIPLHRDSNASRDWNADGNGCACVTNPIFLREPAMSSMVRRFTPTALLVRTFRHDQRFLLTIPIPSSPKVRTALSSSLPVGIRTSEGLSHSPDSERTMGELGREGTNDCQKAPNGTCTSEPRAPFIL